MTEAIGGTMGTSEGINCDVDPHRGYGFLSEKRARISPSCMREKRRAYRSFAPPSRQSLLENDFTADKRPDARASGRESRDKCR